MIKSNDVVWLSRSQRIIIAIPKKKRHSVDPHSSGSCNYLAYPSYPAPDHKVVDIFFFFLQSVHSMLAFCLGSLFSVERKTRRSIFNHECCNVQSTYFQSSFPSWTRKTASQLSENHPKSSANTWLGPHCRTFTGF